MRDFLLSIFSVDSYWSVVTRGLIWIIAVIILAYAADEGHKRKQIKNEEGMFFFYLITTVIFIYIIFGFAPTLQ